MAETKLFLYCDASFTTDWCPHTHKHTHRHRDTRAHTATSRTELYRAAVQRGGDDDASKTNRRKNKQKQKLATDVCRRLLARGLTRATHTKREQQQQPLPTAANTMRYISIRFSRSARKRRSCPERPPRHRKVEFFVCFGWRCVPPALVRILPQHSETLRFTIFTGTGRCCHRSLASASSAQNIVRFCTAVRTTAIFFSSF